MVQKRRNDHEDLKLLKELGVFGDRNEEKGLGVFCSLCLTCRGSVVSVKLLVVVDVAIVFFLYQLPRGFDFLF